jgi:hypothetical protein
MKREFIKSSDDDDEAASPKRKINSTRTKDERNGTSGTSTKNGMDHFSRKRSFSMDMSNEIKSNNQSDADIKVRSCFSLSSAL